MTTIFTVIVEPDDFSVIVPDDEIKSGTGYLFYYLTDHSGNYLTDHSGNYLIARVGTPGNVYSVRVPPDDFSVIVPEE